MIFKMKVFEFSFRNFISKFYFSIEFIFGNQNQFQVSFKIIRFQNIGDLKGIKKRSSRDGIFNSRIWKDSKSEQFNFSLFAVRNVDYVFFEVAEIDISDTK